MSAAAGGFDEALRRAAALVYVDDLVQLDLGVEDAHHLARVLRLRPGEAVVACDGTGGLRHCRLAVEAAVPRGRGALRLEPSAELVRLEPPAAPLTIGFALTKGERADWTVQKLTEIGIDRIVPLITDRTIVRLDASDAERRAERFRRIAREAGAQSRRAFLPEVVAPTTLRALLAESDPSETIAIAEPGGDAIAPGARTLLVGPEGGWSDAELDACPAKVGLARTVLRSETAAIVAGTLLVQAAGRLGP